MAAPGLVFSGVAAAGGRLPRGAGVRDGCLPHAANAAMAAGCCCAQGSLAQGRGGHHQVDANAQQNNKQASPGKQALGAEAVGLASLGPTNQRRQGRAGTCHRIMCCVLAKPQAPLLACPPAASATAAPSPVSLHTQPSPLTSGGRKENRKETHQVSGV